MLNGIFLGLKGSQKSQKCLQHLSKYLDVEGVGLHFFDIILTEVCDSINKIFFLCMKLWYNIMIRIFKSGSIPYKEVKSQLLAWKVGSSLYIGLIYTLEDTVILGWWWFVLIWPLASRLLYFELCGTSFPFFYYLKYFRSVNEVICHGIPDMRPLEDGDLCNSKHILLQ